MRLALILAALPAAVAFRAFRTLPGARTLPATRGLRAGPVDDILDAIDSMLGVSPLQEVDLKDAAAGNEKFLVQRSKEREDAAPPPDALDKPSVAVFFVFLGLFGWVILGVGLGTGVLGWPF